MSVRLLKLAETVNVITTDTDSDRIAQILAPVEEWWPALWDYYDAWHPDEVGDKPRARA